MPPKKSKIMTGPEANIRQLKRRNKEPFDVQTKIRITNTDLNLDVSERERNEIEKSRVISQLIEVSD